MKLGAENRGLTVFAAVLFVAAVLLVVRMVASGTQPAAATSPASNRVAESPQAGPARSRARRAAPRTPNSRPTPDSATVSLDPRLRLDLLKQSEETEYKGTGRNIFRAEAEIPKPIVNPVTAKKTPPPPPQPQVYTPPPPPPINLKFFGVASSPGEPTKAFLGSGDDVFVAAEGDIVKRRYRIVRINASSIEVEDVLSNNRQTIPLTAG
ncbi:MAG: hypothetical protein ACR2IF_16750 [Terriglobales bacterium]